MTIKSVDSVSAEKLLLKTCPRIPMVTTGSLLIIASIASMIRSIGGL